MDISFSGEAAIIMDAAALFVLAGMTVYTSLYRKRGKTADRLFFVLILVDIAAAVSDSILYVLAGYGIPLRSPAYFICFSIFFLAVDAFSLLFCAFQMYRLEWDEAGIKRTLAVLCVPELILVIFLFGSIFTDSFYSGELVLGSMPLTVYDFLTFAPIVICGFFTVAVSIKKNRQILILIILLLVVHLFLSFASVSTVTPLFLALYLMYSHFLVMREAFYGEEMQQ